MHQAGSLVRSIILIVVLLSAAAAALLLFPAGRPVAASPAPASRLTNPWNRQQVDLAVGRLRTGDLALRTGADATSYLLRQMNLTDKSFSHCGIVLVEQGQPFVYHCIGGEDN